MTAVAAEVIPLASCLRYEYEYSTSTIGDIIPPWTNLDEQMRSLLPGFPDCPAGPSPICKTENRGAVQIRLIAAALEPRLIKSLQFVACLAPTRDDSTCFVRADLNMPTNEAFCVLPTFITAAVPADSVRDPFSLTGFSLRSSSH